MMCASVSLDDVCCSMASPLKLTPILTPSYTWAERYWVQGLYSTIYVLYSTIYVLFLSAHATIR